MTAPTDAPADLDTVRRLTAALTDHVLDAQIRGETIPEDQAGALRKAADLLRDHDVPWPPMLTQVLHDLPGAAPSAPEAEAEPVGGLDMGGLSRFFSGLRRDRGEA